MCVLCVSLLSQTMSQVTIHNRIGCSCMLHVACCTYTLNVRYGAVVYTLRRAPASCACAFACAFALVAKRLRSLTRRIQSLPAFWVPGFGGCRTLRATCFVGVRGVPLPWFRPASLIPPPESVLLVVFVVPSASLPGAPPARSKLYLKLTI